MDEIDDLERKYIREYNSINRDFGYNFEGGGSSHDELSEETRKRMSLAKAGVYDGEKNPMYGKHIRHTDEWKERAREQSSGANNPMYGEAPEKRPVLCVETNIVYESRSEAARELGIESSRISRAIKRNGCAAGYHWKNVV